MGSAWIPSTVEYFNKYVVGQDFIQYSDMNFTSDFLWLKLNEVDAERLIQLVAGETTFFELRNGVAPTLNDCEYRNSDGTPAYEYEHQLYGKRY